MTDVRVMMVEDSDTDKGCGYSCGVCCKHFIRTDKSCFKDCRCTCYVCLESIGFMSFITTIALSFFGALFYCCRSRNDPNCNCCTLYLPPWKAVYFATSWFVGIFVLCVLAMGGFHVSRKYGAKCCPRNCSRGFEETII